MELLLHISQTSTFDGGRRTVLHLARSVPGKGAPDTLSILGRVDPRADVVVLEKIKKSLATTGNRTKIRALPWSRRLITVISSWNTGFTARPVQWWIPRYRERGFYQYFACLLSVSFHQCPILIHSLIYHRRYIFLAMIEAVKQHT
jgi:hypothetical protein